MAELSVKEALSNIERRMKDAVVKAGGNADDMPGTSTSQSTNQDSANPFASLSRRNRSASEFTIGKRDSAAAIRGLFDFAKTHANELKGAGDLITEDDLYAIFNSEMAQIHGSIGSGKKSSDESTDKLMEAFQSRVGEILDKLNRRLHGEDSNFMSKGSISDYLHTITRRENLKDANLLTSSSLTTGGQGGLSNFVLSADVDQCMSKVEALMKKSGIEMSPDNLKGLTIQVLLNGSKKDIMKPKLGGKSIKGFEIPRFGSIEKDGDNIDVIGGEEFINDFLDTLDNYLLRTGHRDEVVKSDAIEPHKSKSGSIRKGMFHVALPANPYFRRINELAATDELMAVQFNVGETSLDNPGNGNGGGSSGKTSKKGSGDKDKDGDGAADAIQHNMSKETAMSGSEDVSNMLTFNNLAMALVSTSMKTIADEFGLSDELSKAVESAKAGQPAGLTGFTSKLICKMADIADVDYDIKKGRMGDAVHLHASRSLIDLYNGQNDESQKGPDLRAGGRKTRELLNYVLMFNNNLISAYNNAVTGTDLSDLKNMSDDDFQNPQLQAQLFKLLMPVIHLDELAKECFYGPGDDNIDYIRAYLIYNMGPVVGFNSSENAGLFINPADFIRKMGITKSIDPRYANAYDLKELILNIEPNRDEVKAFEYKFKSAAKAVDKNFYDNNLFTTEADLPKSPMTKALMFISPSIHSPEDAVNKINDMLNDILGVGGEEDDTKMDLNKYVETVTKPLTAKSFNEIVLPMVETIKQYGKSVFGNIIIDVPITDASKDTYKPVVK